MISFGEVKEKDLSILASLYSVISLDIKKNENWTFQTALSYMEYFYHNQPDLFICAYDDGIPIAAIMSTLKPSFDALHLTCLELFVSSDYREQNIEKKLLEMHFELASAKYHVSHIDTTSYINDIDDSLYKKVGLKPSTNLVVMQGSLENCLKKIREEI